MLLPFQLGSGGPLGDGRAWWSWIAIEDLGRRSASRWSGTIARGGQRGRARSRHQRRVHPGLGPSVASGPPGCACPRSRYGWCSARGDAGRRCWSAPTRCRRGCRRRDSVRVSARARTRPCEHDPRTAPEGHQGMKRLNISSGTPWEPIVGYSGRCGSGNTVHVAGTTATDERAKIVGPGTPYAQANQAMRSIEHARRRAGATATDVVRTRIYVDEHQGLGAGRPRASRDLSVRSGPPPRWCR